MQKPSQRLGFHIPGTEGEFIGCISNSSTILNPLIWLSLK